MLPRVSLALAALLLAPAAAQLRPEDAALTWYSSASCGAAAFDGGSMPDASLHQTLVVVEQGTCERVPGADAA